MSEEQSNTSKRFWPLENVYYVSIYFIATGSLYLWGYWTDFNVNILEYINITDIVKITAFQLAICAIIIALGISGGEYMARRAIKKSRLTRLPSRSLPLEDQLAQLNRSKKILKIIVLGISPLVVFASIYSGNFIFVASAVPGAVIYYYLHQMPILKSISHAEIRRTVIFFISCFPFIAYSWGQQKANNIIEGKKYTYVISDFASNPLQDSATSQLRYIGSAGDHTFFFNPKRGSTVIAKSGEDKILELVEHRDIFLNHANWKFWELYFSDDGAKKSMKE